MKGLIIASILTIVTLLNSSMIYATYISEGVTFEMDSGMTYIVEEAFTRDVVNITTDCVYLDETAYCYTDPDPFYLDLTPDGEAISPELAGGGSFTGVISEETILEGKNIQTELEEYIKNPSDENLNKLLEQIKIFLSSFFNEIVKKDNLNVIK